MPHERFDIYTSSYWVYSIYQFSGFSLYSFSSNRKRKSANIRKKNVFINILLIVSYLVLSYEVGSNCNNFESRELTSVCTNIQFIMCFAITSVLWVTGHICSRRMTKLFKAIDNTDRKLRTLTKNEFQFIRNGSHLRSFWLIYLRIVIFGVQITIQFYVIRGYVPPFCFAAYWMAQIVLINCGCLFVFLINYYAEMFELVNCYIQRLMSDNKKIACIETTIAPKVDICYKLEDVRFIYCQLSNIIVKTNKIFQVSLLIKALWTFVFGVLFMYSAVNLFLSYPESYSQVRAMFEKILQLCLLLILDFAIDIYAYEALKKKVT